MMLDKCPKCGYDPNKNLEKEKDNAMKGKFKIEDIITATKSILPDIWIDEPK